MTRTQLMDDLEFIRFYKMICELIVEYHDEHDFVFTKEEAQERVDGCKLIISRITEELA